jgi:type I restriction enzyme S subunit
MSPRQRLTTTGGRTATTRHIFGERVLSVGMPINQPAPPGWRWVPLTEVATMESGHTPSREHPEYWNGDIPWLGVRDAGRNHGTVIDDTSEHTNQLGVDNSSARLLPAGTVCLSRGGTVGYVVMLGRPMCTSQGFANWICGPELDARFLMHLLLSEKRGLDRFAIGTTIQTIYYPDLKALHVCIPSLSEQQRIVRMLDKAFEGIAIAKANAETNFQNACALFESCLRAAFTQSGLRRDDGQGTALKQEWRKMRLGDLLKVQNGFAFSSKQFSSTEGMPLVRIRSLKGGTEDETFFSGPFEEQYLVNAGDLLIGMDGEFGCYEWKGPTALLNQRVCRLQDFKKELLPRFLYHGINSHLKAIESATGFTTVKHLSSSTVLNIRFPVPSLAEQQRIVRLLDELVGFSGALKSGYIKKLAALDDLRKSILDQAFRAEVKAA